MNNEFPHSPSIEDIRLIGMPILNPIQPEKKFAIHWLNLSILTLLCMVLFLLFPGCQRAPSEVASTHPPFNPLMAGVVQTPIIEPEVKRTGELNEKDFLADEDLVLGVEVNGEHRAYPINQLTGPKRELINDYLGGEPILVTW